jgi:hypothetical protein
MTLERVQRTTKAPTRGVLDNGISRNQGSRRASAEQRLHIGPSHRRFTLRKVANETGRAHDLCRHGNRDAATAFHLGAIGVVQ